MRLFVSMIATQVISDFECWMIPSDFAPIRPGGIRRRNGEPDPESGLAETYRLSIACRCTPLLGDFANPRPVPGARTPITDLFGLLSGADLCGRPVVCGTRRAAD
jgi:hypothetical protein